jgi:haloacetate dehalogenase
MHSTVVVPDLRGYGDSSKPPAGENFINYSKRALALTGALVVFLLYQKGRDSRIFQAQDRAIEDFKIGAKPSLRRGSLKVS